jgi:peroxiredoxin
MFARKEAVAMPEVGGKAPAFNLPSAQGGQLRLSMRTARGPVVVVFYEGPTEEEVAYFADLASKEDEINMAAGSIVGIGIAEPDEARDFVEKTGLKSYVLYDYARVATREYGLLQKDKKRGEYARPATFVVDGDHKIVHAWVGERPNAAEVLAAVSGITGLPKPAEEAEEQPEEAGAEAAGEKPKKMSAEERERIKAERRAAREAGKSVKSAEDETEAGSSEKPERKRLSPEEREKRRAERRAARNAGGESAEGEKKPAPKAEKEGVKAEGVSAEETGEKAEALDPAGAQAGADEETAGKSDAANPTGAQAVATPAEGDGPENEASGGDEPGGPEGKAAKGE